MKNAIRAHHVGSLLRTEEIKQARSEYKQGDITKDELWEIENKEIEKLVAKQAEIGLKIVTDGEVRRYSYYHDFFGACNGVELVESAPLEFSNNKKTEPLNFAVKGRVSLGGHSIIEEFDVLHQLSEKYGVKAKAIVPSPSLFLYRDISEEETEIYETEEALFADLVIMYQDLITKLYEAGCRHLQFDDTAWNFFFNEEPGLLEFRELDRDRMLQLLKETTNKVLSVKPDDMEIGVHICRGNFKSEHLTEGGYGPIAEVVFGELKYDKLLLEYDDERSGDFDVLKYVKDPNVLVVLGLITTKNPELEDKDVLNSRIREASDYLSMEQMALSPQCGFSSTEEGNNLTEDEQWQKLKYVVEVSDEIWA